MFDIQIAIDSYAPQKYDVNHRYYSCYNHFCEVFCAIVFVFVLFNWKSSCCVHSISSQARSAENWWAPDQPGGYSPNFRVGVCRWYPKSLTLFPTKKSFKMIPCSWLKAWQVYPVLEKFRRIILLRICFIHQPLSFDKIASRLFRNWAFAKPFILNSFKFDNLFLTWNACFLYPVLDKKTWKPYCVNIWEYRPDQVMLQQHEDRNHGEVARSKKC